MTASLKYSDLTMREKAIVDALRLLDGPERNREQNFLTIVSGYRARRDSVINEFSERLKEAEAGLGIAQARIKVLEWQAQSQWIPTGERLPPEASQCLIFTDEGILQASYVHSGMFFSGGHRERPSHWMLQPEPPKP